jgi:hypothetical protein
LGNGEYDYNYEYANSTKTKIKIKKVFEGLSISNSNNLLYTNNKPNIISFKINQNSDFIILGSKKFIKLLKKLLYI